MSRPLSSLQCVALILGAPSEALRRTEDPEQLRALSTAALLLLGVGSGAFGVLLGWTRSPLQGLYAGLKLPLAWLVTLAVCVPAYYAVAAVLGTPLRLRSLCAAVLMATGRASAVLLGFLPILWLLIRFGVESDTGYHRLLAVAMVLYGVAGLAALGIMARLCERSRSLFVLLSVGLFLFVGGQSAWTLRPFVGRPADGDVPFLRAPEDTFLHAAPRLLRSAAGHYDRVAPHVSREGGR